MNARRIVGLALVIIGIVTLAWGGVFWTDRDTLLDAGPVEITSQEREGFALPPVVGVDRLDWRHRDAGRATAPPDVIRRG